MLLAASSNGLEEIVKLLLKAGANVNPEFGSNDNALEAASLNDHEEIVRLLIEAGAFINAEGGYHGNALQAASAIGHEGITRLLLKNGEIANNKTTEAESLAMKKSKKLICNALKSQASSHSFLPMVFLARLVGQHR